MENKESKEYATELIKKQLTEAKREAIANHKEPVFVITPIHNRKERTLRCLRNLAECGDLQRFTVIIIDDGSTDQSAAAIGSLYPEVIILPGDGDLWWTGAMALGMQYASDHGAEHLIWLNDDCLPERGTLPQLVQFMRSRPNAMVAPVCYTRKGNLLQKHHNAFQGRRSFTANVGEIIPANGFSGWCVGMPISVFRRIGPPDARRYPHYSGDDMYTLRATRAGFKAFLMGSTSVTLVGPVHERGDFRTYIRKYIQPGKGLLASLAAIFWSKKSPYRLPTLFFAFSEKYGLFLGLCLSLVKTSSWLYLWAQHQFIRRIRPVNNDGAGTMSKKG